MNTCRSVSAPTPILESMIARIATPPELRRQLRGITHLPAQIETGTCLRAGFLDNDSGYVQQIIRRRNR
jgi:hypothetical protein